MARFRRLRKTSNIRDLVRETRLSKDNFILPFFVIEGRNKKQSIDSMPEVYRYSADLLLKSVGGFIKRGGKAGLLFGIPTKKDKFGSEAYNPEGIVARSIRLVKKEFPYFTIFTDVCLCAYTDHGHCGVIQNDYVDNDKTLPLLSKMALTHAQAGADFIAPSDMMDLRVKAIRSTLDKHELTHTGILSYSVKYASAFYGPFRDAALSKPQSGDRKTYQMDYANKSEALKEAQQDIKEGADMIMVKPALAYLDVISLLKEKVSVPIVAYNVSGEYSMVKAAAQRKWINEESIVLETMTSMKRAGATMIITYHANDVLEWIK